MPRPRRLGILAVVLATLGPAARGDTVFMKNGNVYRGEIDRDNTIVFIFDGLKRVVVRETKIARIESDASYRNLERFQLVQPLVVHGGTMPPFALDVQASPWDDKGRRSFRYVGPRSKEPVRMEQAINELGPHMVKLRGVDGFWTGQLATSQVPRDVVLGLLARVDRKDQNERLRVARFLIQAEWYAEAKRELDAVAGEFPELRETIDTARASVVELEAAQLRDEIAVRRRAQQPREVAARLKAFPIEGVSAAVLAEVRDAMRQDETRAASDRALADDLRVLAGRLPGRRERPGRRRSSRSCAPWPRPPTRSATGSGPGRRRRPRRTRRTRRGSPWPCRGSSSAPRAPSPTWRPPRRSGRPATSCATTWPAATRRPAPTSWRSSRRSIGPRIRRRRPRRGPSTSTRCRGWPSGWPRRSPRRSETPGEPILHRVRDDENVEPTEYAVLLPPEYHPLRSYPAVVALHGGEGPSTAIAWWREEARRRGYIVIAPEYNLPGQASDYRYTTSEHAAVELALRDARRRYAIDGDRVFLGGQLLGGNMAWDFGLAHPDLFAGVAIVSGLPFKYAYRYHPHVERLPLYVALGDLAPAANEVVFANLVKPLIAKAYDVTYVEYLRRGLEALPEEAAPIFDWMDRRRRDPAPKEFEALSARDSDNRFYGVVIREFLPGRAVAPEAVEPFGKNLKPATIKVKSSRVSNLVRVQTEGIKRLDLWISPKLIDLKKRFEVRINNKTFFKGMAKPDLEPFLEDLRLRGDRQQIYLVKVPVG